MSVAGGPFHDPATDEALFDAIRAKVDRSRVELIGLDTDVNDPEFAQAMATRLNQYVGEAPTRQKETDEHAPYEPI